MSAEKPKRQKMYTYQELAPEFEVHPKTVSRWFARYTIFRPTNGTARVPQDVLDQFIRESGKKLKGTK